MMNNNDNGFTLIELVVVILVLTILSVFALPDLSSADEYSASTDRDQLVSLLRSVQTRAMQNTENIGSSNTKKCYGVSFTNTNIGMLAQNNDGSCQANFITESNATDGYLNLRVSTNYVALNSANAVVTAISFDDFGRPFPQSRYRITFSTDQSTQSACIESEGYIHACP